MLCMDCIFNWLVFGGIAFLLILLNLIRSVMGCQKKWEWQVLMFSSFSFGGLAFLDEYQMVSEWVQKDDISALKDVVPGTANMLTIAVAVVIVLNLIVLIINMKKTK